MDFYFELLRSLLPSLIVGIFLSVWNSRQNKREVQRIKVDEDRAESELVRISLLIATAQLTRAVAIAQKRGFANGQSGPYL